MNVGEFVLLFKDVLLIDAVLTNRSLQYIFTKVQQVAGGEEVPTVDNVDNDDTEMVPYIVMAYVVMALYSYGPIQLWPM